MTTHPGPAPIECATEAQFRAVAVETMTRRGAVTVLEIQHDHGCPALRTGVGCTCDPDLLLVDITSGTPTVLARMFAPTPLAGA